MRCFKNVKRQIFQNLYTFVNHLENPRRETNFLRYFDWYQKQLQNIRSQNHGTSRTSALISGHWNPFCQFFWKRFQYPCGPVSVLLDPRITMWLQVFLLNFDELSTYHQLIAESILQQSKTLNFFFNLSNLSATQHIFQNLWKFFLRERLPRTSKVKDRQK